MNEIEIYERMYAAFRDGKGVRLTEEELRELICSPEVGVAISRELERKQPTPNERTK